MQLEKLEKENWKSSASERDRDRKIEVRMNMREKKEE